MNLLNYITDIYSWSLQNYWEAIKRVGGKENTPLFSQEILHDGLFSIPFFHYKIMEQILNRKELIQKLWKFFHWFLLSLQVACHY